MNKIFYFILLVGLAGISFAGTYSGGAGTAEDPYKIATAEDMQAIGADPNDWDKHFVLMADIDLGQYDGKDGREKFNVIGADYDCSDCDCVGGDSSSSFRGVFDGNNHTISNFSYEVDAMDGVGLFGFVRSGEIKNLGLINPYVNAGVTCNCGSLVGTLSFSAVVNCYSEGGSVVGVSGDGVGGLVGEQYISTIADSHYEGSVLSSYIVGGLVGYGEAGVITNCYTVGEVTGEEYVGGLVGYAGTGAITNCYTVGEVTGEQNVGGLVGYNWRSMTTGCYTMGSVDGNDYVGGLVGDNNGPIIECHAISDVTGEHCVGGLVGQLGYKASDYLSNDNEIRGSHAEGSVTGNTSVGGLVGQSGLGRINDCSATGSVEGISNVGGLVGENAGECEHQIGYHECYGTWIRHCYSTADVTGESNVGGLVGLNQGYIWECYAKDAAVLGSYPSGGLVGYNEFWIEDCYSATEVESGGGLVGENAYYCIPWQGYLRCENAGEILNCFWDKEISQQEFMCAGSLPETYCLGGTISCSCRSIHQFGKTSVEMMQESTFWGWDFINTWNIGENQTYPYLRKYSASDINKDRVVNMLDLSIIAEQWMED